MVGVLVVALFEAQSTLLHQVYCRNKYFVMAGQSGSTKDSLRNEESNKPCSLPGSLNTTIFMRTPWYGLLAGLLVAIFLMFRQDFIAIVDANTEEVLQIDFPPHYKSAANGEYVLSVPKTHLPSLSDATEALRISNRERIPPARKAFDFLPDLMLETETVLGPAGSEAKEKKAFKHRDDIKPLHIVQPEGVSFKMNGNELEWQNWKMHIGKVDFSSSQTSLA